MSPILRATIRVSELTLPTAVMIPGRSLLPNAR